MWKTIKSLQEVEKSWDKMELKFSLVSLFTVILGPRTEAWPEDCSASSKSNDLKTTAKLYAHRCYLKVNLIWKEPGFRILFPSSTQRKHLVTVIQSSRKYNLKRLEIICNLGQVNILFSGYSNSNSRSHKHDSGSNSAVTHCGPAVLR